MAPFRTKLGLDRLVIFSDAVVAIAITLLMLPLVDVAVEIEGESLGELLSSNLDTIIAFGFTFAVIARLWFAHHRIFEGVVDYDDITIVINFLWIASIVIMPFTANVLDHSEPGDPGVNALYIGTVLFSSTSLLWLVARMARHPELTDPAARPHLRVRDLAITSVTIAVALVLSVIFPTIGVFWLLLLILASVVARVLRRRAAGPHPQSVS